MDCKRPEASGGSQPISSDSPANHFPTICSRSRAVSDTWLQPDGDSSSNPSPKNQSALPLLNWDLFRDFSLSSENAAYTLHDGFGRFLDATGESRSIWNQRNGDLPKGSVFDLVEDPSSFKAWFTRLDLPQNQEEAAVKTVWQKGPTKQIRLKRIPLFVGIHPEQTRIVLKAVESPSSKSETEATETDRILRFSCSSKGCLESANAVFTSLFGLGESNLQSVNIADIVHPNDLDQISEYLSNEGTSEEEDFLQIRFNIGGKLERSFVLHGRPTSIGHVFRGIDITFSEIGTKRIIDKLNNALPGYSIAVLGNPAENSPFIGSNLLFEIETGYSQQEFIRKSFSDLRGEATDKDTADYVSSCIARSSICEKKIYLYRKNNEGFWVKARVLPLRNSEGAMRGSALMLENITREREAQSIAMQQESLRTLGQMASGIAHDFNNLLAPILGFSELLLKMPEEGRDNQKLVSFLEKIKVAAQDGAAVVNRLREFYSSQNQEIEVAVDIDPHSLAQQVKDLTQHRWKSQAEARGVDIAFVTKIDTNKCLHGNESEIRQALSNIVLNAADAIESDGSINVSIHDYEDQIRIQISDTGKGMSESEILKCQNPFYSTKGKSGTGLGLSIVSNIVKRHGGEFQIESDKRVGSKVTILLPAKEAAKPASLTSPTDKRIRPLRVMLVDDEAVFLEVISELLGNGGHEVDNFESAEAAVNAFGSKPYDLVITDRAMPNMTGDALAKKIKSQSPNTPIIMVTGFGDIMDSSEDPPKYVDLLLAKPVPLNTLNQRILELVDRERC